MAQQIAIPAYAHRVYQRLAKLNDAQFDLIAEHVGRATASPDLTGVLAWAEESKVEGAASIMEAISQGASFASARHLDPSEIAASLDVGVLKLSSGQEATLRSRIVSLLSTPAVWLSVRALDLILAEKTFVASSRFLTDLRPVFETGKNGDDLPSPKAGMILHSLVLEYNDGGEDRVLSVTFDPDDLAVLKSALDRAEKKTQALQRFMEGAGMVDVSPRVSE